MKDRYDVAIVGGGIAGSALATRLAREGVDVVVLEQSVEFCDRVRGEAMMPWGVAETKKLDLYDILKEAGGLDTKQWILYDEGLPREASEAAPVPVGSALPDAPPLNLGHPAACGALAAASERAGAEFRRGVMDVRIGRTAPRTVEYKLDGDVHELSARLLVGADGRRSTVRRQAGISLDRQEPTHMLSGLLVDPAGEIPEDDAIAVEGDIGLLSFRQPSDRVRVYTLQNLDQRSRFTGAAGAEKLLAAIRLQCLPFADALADGSPAGPCATYPGDETWTDRPFADGVVLIGDAAGYNSPILGQGLSLAMRDVRLVAETLLGNTEWTAEMFVPYGEERVERMRRCRINANLLAAIFSDFGPGGAERRVAVQFGRMSDPTLLQGLFSAFTGPETAPPEAFTDDIYERVLGRALF